LKVHAAPGRVALDVDARLRTPRGPDADARLRGDTKAAMAAFAEELAAGVKESPGRAGALGSNEEHI